MPFVVGENIGPYRLMNQLGQGGMATVFKAYHPALDRYVAIKAIHPIFVGDENFLARFQREARVVAKLEHPNIMPIYDFAEHEGRPYLVMKYIEGQTLKELLYEGPLTYQEILDITEKVCSALEYAHKNDVLHRDIKPSNIILTNDQQVYLVDFGLARMMQSGETSLTTDRIIGTPQYISPEQAVGKSDLDGRTDIYSLGITIYEMLIGKVPFNSDTPFAIIHDHIYSPLPLPSEIKPDLPLDIERVLLKALAKEPEDRYKSVSEFITAFRQAVESIEPILLLKSEEEQIESEEITEPKASTLVFTQADEIEQEKEVTPPSTVAESSSSAQDANAPIAPAPPKKKSNKAIIIGSIIGLMVFSLLCILIGGRVLRNIATARREKITLTASVVDQQIQQTQPVVAASIPVARTPSAKPPINQQQVDLEAADAALERALIAWKANDFDSLEQELLNVRMLAGATSNYYLQTARNLSAQEAWLVMSMLFFDPARYATPEMTNEDIVTRAHEITYKAARDPLAEPYLNRNKDYDLMEIAGIRYEMFHGDPQTAKNLLGPILENEEKLNDFPEARLLEAEIFIQIDDPRGKQLLQEIISDDSLPAWIIREAVIINKSQ